MKKGTIAKEDGLRVCEGKSQMMPFIAHFRMISKQEKEPAGPILTFDPSRELAVVTKGGILVDAIDDPTATSDTGSLLTEANRDSSRDEPTDR